MKKKYCIITGAASGIGEKTFKLFSSKGYVCIGIDKDQERLNQLKFCEYPIHLLYFDLLNENVQIDIRNALENILEDANFITLVNNVGGSILHSSKSDALDWDAYYRTIEFNLKPTVIMTNAIDKFIKKTRNSRIVNISSISARAPLETIKEDYAAAKAAMIGYSRKKAMELSKYGVLVNTVCPGIIATERIAKRWENRDPEYNSTILAQIPLGRLGEPEEVAKAVYFLGSEENNYITGAILDVNGGMYMP